MLLISSTYCVFIQEKNMPARAAGAANSPSYNLSAVAVVVAQQ